MIIGVHGKKRTGKDTISNIISSEYGYKIVQLASPIKYCLNEAYNHTITVARIKRFKNIPMSLELDNFYDNINGIDRDNTNLFLDKQFMDQFMDQFVSEFINIFVIHYSDLLRVDINYRHILDMHEQKIYDLLNEPITIRRLMQYFGTDLFVSVYPETWLDISCNDIRNENYIISDVRQMHEYKYVIENGGTIIHCLRKTNYNDSHKTECGLKINDNDIVINNDGTLEELKNKVYEVLKGIHNE